MILNTKVINILHSFCKVLNINILKQAYAPYIDLLPSFGSLKNQTK